MENRFATSTSKALVTLAALLALFIHPQKSHGLSCGTLFSFSEFIPPQSPTTETIRKAARFIRAQAREENEVRDRADAEYGTPFDLSFSLWRDEVPADLAPIFRAAHRICSTEKSGFENSARWVESLEPDLIREAGSGFRLTGELFLSVLKTRATRLGWDEVTELKKHYSDFQAFQREVLSLKRPFIDVWAKDLPDHLHGWFTHLIQWVYVAESLESYKPGSARKFFDFVTSRDYVTFWSFGFENGGLFSNPAFTWSVLGHAFNFSFTPKPSAERYRFIDPSTNEPLVLEHQD